MNFKTLFTGGIPLTMKRVKGTLCFRELRGQTNQTVRKYNICWRFQGRTVGFLHSGKLSEDRTKRMHPFQMIGVDYACTGRLGRTEGKTNIALYGCSLNRAPYLNLMTKRFIVRNCGRRRYPPIMVRCLQVLPDGCMGMDRNDKKCHQFVAEYKINWHFNLSRAHV